MKKEIKERFTNETLEILESSKRVRQYFEDDKVSLSAKRQNMQSKAKILEANKNMVSAMVVGVAIDKLGNE